MNNSNHIADLIVKKIRGTLTPAEWSELESWIGERPENKEAYERATDPKQQLGKLEIYRIFDSEKVRSSLEDQLFPTRTLSVASGRFLRYAAAILLPVLIAGGAYLFLSRPSPATLAELDNVFRPGSQKATLLLSDGRTVTLDSVSVPADLQEGNTRIRNENNRLSYFAGGTGQAAVEPLFNELRTPRGGGYQLTLADGSGVWLNAGSSLRFPVSLSDSVRQVYLEGEAYFEVTTTGTPFVVHSGEMDVRVLGTTFNITAYPDESEFRTTLVEGKVRVDVPDKNGTGPASQLLAPSQQAVLDLTRSQMEVSTVNTSYFTSWMQGKIEFDNESLDVVMKRLARWYDFEYVFKNAEAGNYHFTARLDRNASISSILEMLELTTDVKFEYRDDKIVIL